MTSRSRNSLARGVTAAGWPSFDLIRPRFRSRKNTTTFFLNRSHFLSDKTGDFWQLKSLLPRLALVSSTPETRSRGSGGSPHRCVRTQLIVMLAELCQQCSAPSRAENHSKFTHSRVPTFVLFEGWDYSDSSRQRSKGSTFWSPRLFAKDAKGWATRGPECPPFAKSAKGGHPPLMYDLDYRS